MFKWGGFIFPYSEDSQNIPVALPTTLDCVTLDKNSRKGFAGRKNLLVDFFKIKRLEKNKQKIYINNFLSCLLCLDLPARFNVFVFQQSLCVPKVYSPSGRTGLCFLPVRLRNALVSLQCWSLFPSLVSYSASFHFKLGVPHPDRKSFCLLASFIVK